MRLSRIYVSNLRPGRIRRESFDGSIAQVRFDPAGRGAQPVRAMQVHATRKLDGNSARFNPSRGEGGIVSTVYSRREQFGEQRNKLGMRFRRRARRF